VSEDPEGNGDAEEMAAIIKWMSGRDTGMSSMTLACVAVGIAPGRSFLGGLDYPHDSGDRGRCIRLIVKHPFVWRGLLALTQVSAKWSEQAALILSEMTLDQRLKVNQWQRSVA
jgi:hypothetical protein